MWKKLVVVIGLAILERAGVPVALALPYVVANLGAYAAEDKSMFPLAFFAGILVDMVFLNTLGASSIALLLARGVIVSLQNRFGRELPWILALVAIAVSLVVEVWSGDGWRWVYAVSGGISVWAWYWWLMKKSRSRGGIFVGYR